MEHIQPPDIVMPQRRVVESLKVERIRSTVEQQTREFLGSRMRRNRYGCSFPFADHAGQRREPVLAVGEVDVRIGTGIEQQPCNRDGIFARSGDR